jgi:hypothetical protein
MTRLNIRGGPTVSSKLSVVLLWSKYGKIQLTTLKSVLKDFYNADGSAAAKVLLLHDLEKLNLLDRLPSVTKRRDSVNRLAYEVDDILALITYVDEDKLFKLLPS